VLWDEAWGLVLAEIEVAEHEQRVGLIELEVVSLVLGGVLVVLVHLLVQLEIGTEWICIEVFQLKVVLACH